MSPPVVKNLKKREEDGYKSFNSWFDDEKNVYIARNTAKYTRRYDLKDSKWVNPFLCTDWNVAKEEWVVETLKNCYEDYIRKNPTLMEALSELNSKNLGCWCTKTELCHGEVLVKLYIEKFGEGKDYMKQTKDSGEKEKKGIKAWGLFY